MVNDPAKITKKISSLSINNNPKGEGDILAGSKTNPKKNSSLPNKKGKQNEKFQKKVRTNEFYLKSYQKAFFLVGFDDLLLPSGF